MNSCLYKATVMHNRMKPASHRFHYNVFMFYIDLDEIEQLRKKLLFFSHNRFNFFSFRDNEHLQLPIENPDKSKTTKQHILDYLQKNSVTPAPTKIMLLTNLNVLGYNFNPVSFYYCFDEKDQPVCCIAEVGNTFGEMKPYLLSKENLSENTFHLNTAKYFYVSPFMDHDANFDFNLVIPTEKLNNKIDTFKGGERIFISTLTGLKKPINNGNLFWYSIRFPFITLKIITLIHWNALKLWRKKIPYHKKGENQDLQKDVFRKYKND
ncbi:MAG: DUF1365 domain-containing protein [Bacteroidia bacterium]|nr:DUF1365 domain-containing protein [Bacteroidia bacterium]